MWFNILNFVGQIQARPDSVTLILVYKTLNCEKIIEIWCDKYPTLPDYRILGDTIIKS